MANLHRPPAAFLVAPAILAAAGLFFGLVPSRLDDALDDYAETLPAAGAADGYYTWHCGTASACRCCCRSLVLAVGTAAFFGRDRLRRARLGAWLPLGNADRIYDAVIRGADVAVGATDRRSPSAARSRSPSR